MVQKYLWTYWHSESIPDTVTECINSWKVHHPDFTVIVLNENNYSKFVTIDVKRQLSKSDSLFSDILRIKLVKKYGGFWFDSSIMCYSHISSMFDIDNNSDLYAYYMDNFTTNQKYKVIESWFFGANCCSKFLIEWEKEMERNLNDFKSNDEYINDLKKQGVDLQNISLPGYLSIHCAAQKVLQKSNLSFMLSLKSAYDGPFKLHGDANWECQKMQSLLTSDKGKQYKQSLLKLRGSDRNCLTSQYLR